LGKNFNPMENFEQELTNWKEEFKVKFGREPAREDIDNDPIISVKNKEWKEYIRQNAEPPLVGGCTFFIARRRRYCSKRATLNTLFCSSHGAVGDSVEPSRLPNSVVEIVDNQGRKHNLKRPPKRMLNPFLIRDVYPTPDWSLIYTDPTRPLLLDIGCAKGGYIEQLRTNCRKGFSSWKEPWNFLGVELYNRLADAANQAELERNHHEKDLYYIGTNINVSLESLVLPNLKCVTFMFPDPWSCGTGKDKNKKRRVMSSEFAMRLARLIPTGGSIYFASDWHELALDIRGCLMGSNCFDIPGSDYDANLQPKRATSST
jgi:tRNA (guanine-N7-)-methyltransferase